MPRFKVGDTVFVEGRKARVVWLSENPNEIEPMDEYIVEFEDKQRRFLMSRQLEPKEPPPMENRKHDSDSCRP
jgi:hypothetical protein